MPTKNVIANLTFAISVILLCIAWYLYSHSKHWEDINSNNQHSQSNICFGGVPTSLMEKDSSDTLNISEAQSYLDAVDVQCNNLYGAWIGSELLNQIISSKDENNFPKYTGIHVFIGKTKDGSTCFMIKGGIEMKRTIWKLDDVHYYKLHALCPKLCDGLKPH